MNIIRIDQLSSGQFFTLNHELGENSPVIYQKVGQKFFVVKNTNNPSSENQEVIDTALLNLETRVRTLSDPT